MHRAPKQVATVTLHPRVVALLLLANGISLIVRAAG